MSRRRAQRSGRAGLNDLTPSQRQAVEHRDGPLLVLAGPGSGKTRVITRRMARMVEQGVDPRDIVAITFTNKAAAEMRDRVTQLLPGCRIWVSTFHKFCARLLRWRAEAVGLRSNFTIFDTADQRDLIRAVLKSLDIDPVAFSPIRVAGRISRAKNGLITAEDFARQFDERIGHHWEAVVARVYPVYQERLLQSNAVDFDDLLLHVVTLLTENPELRRQMDEQFRYVLVDEYQDTNLAQYRIVRALSQDHPNLCVAGDPDQSIYGWRGARLDNLLRFEGDFPRATVVRLEQNFRSTKRILRAADSLIAHNTLRKVKALVTDNPEGGPVELLCFANGTHEAESIAGDIRRRIDAGENTWSDFAVMYRVNALSREIERALTRQRIPFQVAAGLAFYERAEVKDMLAYLRLIYNPDDAVAFRRIVNTPRRSIGLVTQAKLEQWATSQKLNLPEAAARAGEHPALSKRAAEALQAFAEMIHSFDSFHSDPDASSGAVEGLLNEIIARTAYTADWEDSEAEHDRQRLANVLELVTAARQFEQALGEDATLEGFLETTSLVNEADTLDESAGRVTLLTLHAAKGLEFPVVYVIGVEQNLIPHERSLWGNDLRELEEERRLLFVGMTRAQQRLVLTLTKDREFRGHQKTAIPSPFLSEMAQTELTLTDLSDDWLGGGVGGVTETAGVAGVDRRKPPDATELDASRCSDPSHLSEASAAPSAPATQTDPAAPLLVTTAADLVNGTSNRAEIPQGFAVGMTVRHPEYGLGTVVEMGGFTRRRTLIVEFHDTGHRTTFVAAQCPLQPVGVS